MAFIDEVKSYCRIDDEDTDVYGLISAAKNYLDNAAYRLGLSATPQRHLDDEGTASILSYLGKIIFVNAGKVGYDIFTEPHRLVDDIDLMKHYDIRVYDPETIEDIEVNLNEIHKNDIKISYIRLGKDFK